MKKLIKAAIPLLLVVVVFSLFGCSAKAPSPIPSSPGIEPPTAPMPESSGMSRIFSGSGESAQDISYGTDSGFPVSDMERKIIKNGNIAIEVDDVIETMDSITQIAEAMGGYVVSSNKHSNDETSATVTIRVPADRFDETFEKIREIAIETPYENKESMDVTEEYTDLEAQLRNLEATEAQYLELLKKAENVEDMVTVQRELSYVRGEIERIEGRMKYIERTSDMSFIEVRIGEVQSIKQKKWNPGQAFTSAVNGFISFLKGLYVVLIWIAMFCPIWIPILVVVIRKRRKKKAQAITKDQATG
jgi:hypothetical protein